MKLSCGIHNVSHFWHFLMPTWEAQIKSKFKKDMQNPYLKQLKSKGYQPEKIRIEADLEIQVFLYTVALCFQLDILLITQSEDGTVSKQTINPCTSATTMVLTRVPTPGKDACYDFWIPFSMVNSFNDKERLKVTTTVLIFL